MELFETLWDFVDLNRFTIYNFFGTQGSELSQIKKAKINAKKKILTFKLK